MPVCDSFAAASGRPWARARLMPKRRHQQGLVSTHSHRPPVRLLPKPRQKLELAFFYGVPMRFRITRSAAVGTPLVFPLLFSPSAAAAAPSLPSAVYIALAAPVKPASKLPAPRACFAARHQPTDVHPACCCCPACHSPAQSAPRTRCSQTQVAAPSLHHNQSQALRRVFNKYLSIRPSPRELSARLRIVSPTIVLYTFRYLS